MKHRPVLLKEVLQIFDPKPNQNYIDCTIGEGGHSFAILEKIKPNGKILGIDLNEKVIEKVRVESQKLKVKNIILVEDNFRNLKKIVKDFFPYKIHGILLDLGLSSFLLKESGRGFSFLKDEKLDMRYSLKQDLTAEKIVNSYSLEKLEKIFKEYGEEKKAKKIALEIVKERKKKKIETTKQLVEIIERIKKIRGKIHPATKIFQALRIEVNQELENLEEALPQALEILEKGGKLIIISFHSLEDRIVKKFLKENKERLKILTKKPVRPSFEEIKINPPSRSAKLRAAEKI